MENQSSMLETNFSVEGLEWIKTKVLSSIIGECCNFHNDQQFSLKKSREEIGSWKNLQFLIHHFGFLFSDFNSEVDIYFSIRKTNQWTSHKEEFKKWISEALREVNLEKIC